MKNIVYAIAALLCFSHQANAQVNCTTSHNSIFNEDDTNCSDGSSMTEKYNPVFHEYDQNIQNSNGQTQQCTRQYNSVFHEWETHCD